MAGKKKSSPPPKNINGTIVFNENPLIIQQHFEVDYKHSYAQDSPFFLGLSKKKLIGTRCKKCNYGYATPKTHCMECGAACKWEELPLMGKVHTYTICYYGSEEFLKETPYTLILVEFKGWDTLFLSRLKGVDPEDVKIGMQVKARFEKKPKFKPTDVYFVEDN